MGKWVGAIYGMAGVRKLEGFRLLTEASALFDIACIMKQISTEQLKYVLSAPRFVNFTSISLRKHQELSSR